MAPATVTGSEVLQRVEGPVIIAANHNSHADTAVLAAALPPHLRHKMVVAAASDVRYYRVAPATVSVTVSGPPEVMAILQANQIRAVVDLTDIEAAKDLKRRVDVYVPPGIALVRVEPAKVGVIVPPRPH